MSSSVAVIGVGNPLMGDDGLGLVALDRLAREWQFPDHVRLIDGTTWGLRLLPEIESATDVIILDAIEMRRSPGEVIILEGDQLPHLFDLRITPHHIGLQDVFALLEFRGSRPERIAAIGIQPAAVEWGIGLSTEVVAAVPALLDRTLARLRAAGVDPRPRVPVHA